MKITHVGNGDDWEAIYIDGRIWRQDHRMRTRDWIDLLALVGVEGESLSVDPEQSYDDGCFPDNLEDVE